MKEAKNNVEIKEVNNIIENNHKNSNNNEVEDKGVKFIFDSKDKKFLKQNKYFIKSVVNLKNILSSIREDKSNVYCNENNKTILNNNSINVKLNDKQRSTYTCCFMKMPELKELKCFISSFTDSLKSLKIINEDAFICNKDGLFGFEILRSERRTKQQVWHTDYDNDNDKEASIIINCEETSLNFPINLSEQNPFGEEIKLKPFDLIFFYGSLVHCGPIAIEKTTKLFFYVDPNSEYRNNHKDELHVHQEKETISDVLIELMKTNPTLEAELEKVETLIKVKLEFEKLKLITKHEEEKTKMRKLFENEKNDILNKQKKKDESRMKELYEEELENMKKNLELKYTTIRKSDTQMLNKYRNKGIASLNKEIDVLSQNLNFLKKEFNVNDIDNLLDKKTFADRIKKLRF
jgi:hypothetical protein